MRLCKYDGSHLFSLLKSDTLKVTPPNEFDDPFEFYPELDDITPEDRDALLDHVLRTIGEADFVRQLRLLRIVQSFQEAKDFFYDSAK